MANDTQKIECPRCGKSISIDDALTSQLESKIKSELEAKNKVQAEQIAKEKKKLEEQKSSFEKIQVDSEKEIAKKVDEKLAAEKISLKKDMQEEAKKEMENEKKLLEEQLADKDKKLKEANENELVLRKEKQNLKDEKDAFEIEKARQLDEERKKIEEEASKKATEIQQVKIDQLNKQLTDSAKANSELTRKLEQGSQQTQGEVLELRLEDLLEKEFVFDEIVPVPKGVSGADTIQTVNNKQGVECGRIIWESKKTKAWSEGWVQKLKDDQRTAKADIAVIVSSTLPKGINGLGSHNGIWVCDVKFVIALTVALRTNLIAVSHERQMAVGKNEKMEVLYGYLTGVEFKQRVEAIIESFVSMDEDLKKEKLAYQKMWAQREKQIQKVITNTAGMYGDLSGLVTLPKIETLELSVGDEK